MSGIIMDKSRGLLAEYIDLVQGKDCPNGQMGWIMVPSESNMV
jgi:hypothetical protein